MASTLVECFELLVDAEQLAPRLDAAAAALAQLPALEDEQGWLAAARDRLGGAKVTSHRELLDRALRLPELEKLKSERGKLLQAAIADEVERLQGAIAVAGTERSPLLEMLFQTLKMPALRKCGRTELAQFAAELERRLASSYARRVLATERYLPVVPHVHAFARALATWRSVFVDPPIDEAAAAPVREEVMTAARAIELTVRQARLLAQAALLPAAELLDAAGMLTGKPKRAGKDPDTHALLEHDPPDPLQPSPAERAEIATPPATA